MNSHIEQLLKDLNNFVEDTDNQKEERYKIKRIIDPFVFPELGTYNVANDLNCENCDCLWECNVSNNCWLDLGQVFKKRQ